MSSFTAFRAQQGDVIRHACKIAPLEAFQIAGEWLKYQINSSLNTENALCEFDVSCLTLATWSLSLCPVRF